MLAPIALFVYNRLDHATKTVEALKNNTLAKESKLYIFSDFAKNDHDIEAVKDVRKFIHTITGFTNIEIIERSKNWGLANSIIDGVTSLLQKHNNIIVLEDDLITSPFFLTYMNQMLDLYEKQENILSITGFSFNPEKMKIPKELKPDQFYFHPRPMSWSWAIWKNRWDKIDWSAEYFSTIDTDKRLQKSFNQGGTDLFLMLKLQMQGKLDSWYIRLCLHAWKDDLVTIYPMNPLVSNIGFDGTGVHCGVDNSGKFTSLSEDFQYDLKFITPYSNQKIISNFNKNFNLKKLSLLKKIVRRGLNVFFK